MKSAILSIKIDPKVKKEAQKITSDLGFSLSSVLGAYLKEIIREKRIHFSLNSERPTEYMLQALKESEEDYKAGKYHSFDDPKEALDFLEKIKKEGYEDKD